MNEATVTVHQAIKSGINYIDTAPSYGDSEYNLGLILQDVPRSAFYIATKVGRYAAKKGFDYDYSAERTRDSVLNSLKLLKLDYLDVVQVNSTVSLVFHCIILLMNHPLLFKIHDVEFAENLDVIINECLPTLEQLVREGKLRYIGVSGYPLNILRQCIERAPGRFQVFNQNILLFLILSSVLKTDGRIEQIRPNKG